MQKRTGQAIYYYNTANDRKTNRDEMIKVLDGIQVYEVPTLIIVQKDGSILKYVEDEILKYFENG